jgi:hypothetical protein
MGKKTTLERLKKKIRKTIFPKFKGALFEFFGKKLLQEKPLSAFTEYARDDRSDASMKQSERKRSLWI